MDFAVSVGSSVRDELCTRLIQVMSQLINEAGDVVVEKESFLMFSMYVKQMKTIIEALHGKRVEARTESRPMRKALEELELDVNKALDVIKSHKSRGRFSLLINSGSLLSKMKQVADEIARDVTLLSLANIDATLELKSKTNEIINGFQSMEFKSAASTEAIIMEIEKCNAARNGKSGEYAENLLKQIADAVGVTPNVSTVRSEIQLLQQEKEELELRKQRAEALQLSQLIHLLQSLDTMPQSPPETSAGLQNNLISAFVCPLSGEPMEDPVAICCGHSFERKAISDHFERGEISCPVCEEELSSLELTANISLRSSILEWKNRNMNLRLQKAISAFDYIESDVLNQALEDLQELIDIPECTAEVSRKGLVSKLVNLMQCSSMNTKATLKCLLCLANHSRENKEVIASKGAIRYMIKRFHRGEIEADAVDLLVRLSDEQMIAEQIGNTKDAIPTLVSLVQNPNPEISQKAEIVLRNLPSSNTEFIVKMAEAGHFDPFLAQFHQVPSATRFLMATALTRIQLSESAANKFETEDFIRALTKMLYSNPPDSKSACLLCIKKLVTFQRLARQFLLERDTIPALLGLMYSSISENHWKQEAADILISLVRVSEPADYSTNISLRELHSQHNIDRLLNLTATSTPQTSAALLRFFLAMVQKSEVARDSIHSDQIATICFSSASEGNLQGEVRLQALKLMHFVVKDKPSGFQLPQSPQKESIVTALVTILISSRSIEERSTVAGIIGHLPVDDIAIDEMLCRLEALRSILDVISAADTRHVEMMTREAIPTADDSTHGLLENALAALLRYTDPAKPELWKQVSKLEVYPTLVHVLSTGSSVAKQQTALALTNLCRSTHHPATSSGAATVEKVTIFTPPRWLTEFLDNSSWCCPFSPSVHPGLCPIHGSACSSGQTFCLIKANAIKPLVQMLSETQSGAPETALMALDTLFIDSRTFSNAAMAIVDNQGIAPILNVMEKGLPPAQEKAIDLFEKIFPHCTLKNPQFERLEGILIHLLHFDNLKRKAASMLGQMKVIPQQSSYF
ncbi:U-box domain-containing protein 44-like isoform X2 [Dioscorea cayenensis subsp. rotundata]|nr:U-box domain-containing protein 44-like isoform X2 [Dioscorea cayenensis subsp. rotundata]XP_039133431.1 U-box domain-containing protein 44-like isoform X2 [Dioscorea cayenensis subsp. rotundata]